MREADDAPWQTLPDHVFNSPHVLFCNELQVVSLLVSEAEGNGFHWS